MNTKTVSVKDAQAQFLQLLDLVSMGNRVVIQKDEKPMAELVGFCSSKKGKPAVDFNRGRTRMTDDLDKPLPEEYWQGEL